MRQKLATARPGSPPVVKKRRGLPAPQRRAVQAKTRANLSPARNRLPEYLEAPEIDVLIRSAHDGTAALLMLIQWRAGLRVSEALGLTVADLSLEGERPTLAVRHGKRSSAAPVPLRGVKIVSGTPSVCEVWLQKVRIIPTNSLTQVQRSEMKHSAVWRLFPHHRVHPVRAG